jgi:hypothetical protein
MIWDIYPRFGFFPSRIQGVKKAPDPGSGAAALVDISNNIARCFHRKKMLTAKSSPITVNLFYNFEKYRRSQYLYFLSEY